MTNWKVVEPEDELGEWTLETVYSEEMIIDEYYEFWCSMMKQRNKEHLISKQNCIEDWITVNWASKTTDPIGTNRYRNE